MSGKKLSEEIREFQVSKKKLIPILIIVGLLGLVLPILPGVAVLFLAFLLLFPKEGENILKRIRNFFRN
jgi:uncharacterized protein YqgC (DUF456 family)